MAYNKKVLTKATKNLSKKKTFAKPKDIPLDLKGNGMLDPRFAGKPVKLNTDTLYNPTPYKIKAVADNGIEHILNPFDETLVYFPGANTITEYVDEFPQMQGGGETEWTKEDVIAANKKAQEFNKKYAKSKQYKRLLKKHGYSKQEIQDRINAVMDTNDFRYTNEGPSYVDFLDIGAGPANPEFISYNVTDVGDWGNWEPIAAHEWGHVGVDSELTPLKESERNELISRINPEGLGQTGNPEDDKHDMEPQENRADIVQFKQFLMESGIWDPTKRKKFTKKDLNKYKQLQKSSDENFVKYWNRMFRLYKDDDIIYLLNNIAAVDDDKELNMAQKGGYIEAELTDKEIEEYKKGGYIIEELPEAQEGGETWWQKVLREKEENDFSINLEGLKKGIAHVESADGVLMKNPSSSATGLYGQLFSEQGMSDLYSGTRDEFAKDVDAQNRIFEIRLNQGIGGNALIQDAKDLKKEYAPQIKDFNKMFSNEDIIVLDNFLGRQGTRKYFGNVIRDGKPLAEVFPHLYGKDVAAPNHTPEVYLSKARSYYKKQGGGEKGAWMKKVLAESKAKEAEDAAYERWLDQNLGSKKEDKTYTYVDPITNRTVERSYNDKQIIPAQTRQGDPEKLKAFINSADPAKAAKELAETAYEFTIAPVVRTGERIIDNPVKFVGDVATGVSQIPETAVEGVMTLGSKLFGDGTNYVDIDTDALGVTADVIGSIPAFGAISKGAKPLLKTGLKYADDIIYPTRVYRASPANKSLKNLDYTLSGDAEKIAFEKGLKGKINKKGKFYTKDLEELSQYLKGNQGRRGVFMGDDMIIDEVKLPFWKKNILSDKDVVALKQSQGAVLPGQPRGLFDQVINENEFLIPDKSIFYPRKSTVIKGMPQEISTRPVYVRNYKGDIVDISGEFSPTSTPFTYDSPAYSNQAYKYLEDQINAATGHNIPLHNPNPLQEHTLMKNYVQPANPGTSFNFNKVKEFFNRPPGPLMLLGPNQGGNMIKKNMNYYKQLLDTYDTRKMSAASRKYYNNLINAGKKQDGMVTEAQLRELDRLKTGDFNFGKKGYASGGSTNNYIETYISEEEIQQYVDGGYIVEEVEEEGSTYPQYYTKTLSKRKNLRNLKDLYKAGKLLPNQEREVIFKSLDPRLQEMAELGYEGEVSEQDAEIIDRTLAKMKTLPLYADQEYPEFAKWKYNWLKKQYKNMQEGGQKETWYEKVLREKQEEDEAYDTFLNTFLGSKKETKPSTSNFADRALEVEKRNKALGITPKVITDEMLREQQAEDFKDRATEIGETAFELTGIPSAARVIEGVTEDPLGYTNELISNATQITELPFEAGMTLGSYLFGDGNNYINYDANPEPLLNVVGAAPVFGAVGKGSKLFKIGRTGSKASMVPVSKVNPVELSKTTKIIEAPKPSLQIKSTMPGSPFEKQLSKTGEINVNNIKAHINKADVSKQDKFILQKTLDENFAGQTKINYEDFKTAVSENLVPLKKITTDEHADYGLDRLNYYTTPESLPIVQQIEKSNLNETLKRIDNDIKNIDYEFNNLQRQWENRNILERIDPIKRSDMQWEMQYLKDQKEKLLKEKQNLIKNDPVKIVKLNETVLYGNADELGIGSDLHFTNNPETLGHSRVMVTGEEPDVMHFLESQSDWSQKGRKVDIDRVKKILKNENNQIEITKKYLEEMKIAHSKGIKYQGYPVRDWEIREVENRLKNRIDKVEALNRNLKNPDQKNILFDFIQERLLQENMLYTAEQGKTIMRYPTLETVKKIQGYTPEALNLNPNLQGILNKYKNTPKMVKKNLGVDVELVTDVKGNTWYEWSIPEDFLEGARPIKAFKQGGSIELDLTPEEIQQYVDGGSVDIELDETQVQDYIKKGYILDEL